MLPPLRPFLGKSDPVPFVLVSDEAFALTTNQMKPFSKKRLADIYLLFELGMEICGMYLPDNRKIFTHYYFIAPEESMPWQMMCVSTSRSTKPQFLMCFFNHFC